MSGSGSGRRNIVRDRRVVRNAAIEQRKKVPPIRMRVQKKVNFHTARWLAIRLHRTRVSGRESVC